MDIAPIISVLLKQAPYLIFSLLGLGMVLIGSTGKFIKAEIEPKDRPLFKKVGWLIFWLFLIAALIEIISPGKLNDFVALFPALFSSKLFIVLLLVLILLFPIVYSGVPYARKVITERSYAITVDKVLDGQFISRGETLYGLAGLLVTSNGNILCAAKVSTFVNLRDDQNISVEIKDINPNGYFLRWDDRSGICNIKKHRPRRIVLVDNYEEDGFFREGRFLFENSYTKPLEPGQYRIGIDIFRVSGEKLIQMKTVEGTIKVSIYYNHLPSAVYGDGINISWVEDKIQEDS